MPGVVVTTAVRSGPVGVGEIENSQMFIAGDFQRGSTTEARLVRSFSEFKTYYGDYTTAAANAWLSVKTFFEEGGSRVYVGRVTSAGALAATGSLSDDAGTPLDALDFVAGSVGTWGNGLTVTVLDADSLASGFRLQIELDNAVILTTPDLASEQAAVDYISISSISHLLTASVSASGGDLTLPSAVGQTVTLGVTTSGEGTAPVAGVNPSALTEAEFNTALGLFDYSYGSGAVCMPGRFSTTDYLNLRNHAKANNRIALLGLAAGQTNTQAKAAAVAETAAAGEDAKFSAMYHPHIKVEDPTNAGLSITISPEAFAAAARAKAILEAGYPHRAGAGLISAASPYVKGVELAIDMADGDLLDLSRVNAIRSIGGSIRVYGARSLAADETNWRFITFQDMINYVVVEAESRLEDFVFATIDGRGSLFGSIRASMVSLLDPIRLAGGLYEAYDSNGERLDAGYSVVCNDDNNPPGQLATGTVKVDVGVRVSSVGDKINITITKSNLTASVV